jgi:hypothetical protein
MKEIFMSHLLQFYKMVKEPISGSLPNNGMHTDGDSAALNPHRAGGPQLPVVSGLAHGEP